MPKPKACYRRAFKKDFELKAKAQKNISLNIQLIYLGSEHRNDHYFVACSKT